MLRSILFNVAFYIVTALFVVVTVPFFLAPRRVAMAVVYKGQARAALWLLKVIDGISVEVRGHENLPKGACIVAAKHQSLWETFALTPLLRDPTMIMKAELFWIPFVGWWSWKFRFIPVQRAKGGQALRALLREARDRVRQGREIVIFPEGTRRPPGAEPAYKYGVVRLYEELGVPVCPVALNSGLYWPRRQLRHYPGTIIVEFLPPIPPGLSAEEFQARLIADLEGATRRLLEEAAESPNPPPGALPFRKTAAAQAS